MIISDIRITRGQKVESISNLVLWSVWMFQIRMPWRWFLQLSTVVRNVKGAFLLVNNLLASSKERLCKTLRVFKTLENLVKMIWVMPDFGYILYSFHEYFWKYFSVLSSQCVTPSLWFTLQTDNVTTRNCVQIAFCASDGIKSALEIERVEINILGRFLKLFGHF